MCPPPRSCAPSCQHHVVPQRLLLVIMPAPVLLEDSTTGLKFLPGLGKFPFSYFFQITIPYSSEMEEIPFNSWCFACYCCPCCIYSISGITVFLSLLFPPLSWSFSLASPMSKDSRYEHSNPCLLSQSYQPPSLCLPKGLENTAKKWWKKDGDSILQTASTSSTIPSTQVQQVP